MTTPRIRYGGDYNPEQWPPEVWEEDYDAFDLAAIDTLTIGVFGWSHIQPSENSYDFATLDAIVQRAVDGGRSIVLATPTGAMPPWLSHRYPEVNRTDFEGRRHVYGQRHNHCPSSPVYQRLSTELADRIAERYCGTPGLAAWHVANEYGGPDGSCYCERCAVGFRDWLRHRYGDLEGLNEAWNTMFWSHVFTDWDQVVPPNALSEHWRGPNHTAFQGITLDYRRFMSDALLANFVAEKERIRRHDPLTPVTTNFMGPFRPIDYHRWAPHLDLASWDNYPPGQRQEVRMAFSHDLMRGLKDGAPFWVMEQTPTITASRDVNPVKRPGVLGLWSWQAVAHGADAVLYFQMRQSRGACEKYHGAVLDHAGRTDTRSFKEIADLGHQLQQLGDAVLGARTPARTAVIFDWDSWWAAEMTDGFNRHVSYLAVVLGYYGALWRANAAVDVVPCTADLSAYDVVVAPALHVVKGDITERLRAVVERGGSVITSYWAGRADESARAFLMDAPGPFGDLFGVRVEETDSAAPGEHNPVTLKLDDTSVTTPASLVFEVLVPEGAEVVGTYDEDFYAGRAAVTRHRTGEGEAWYVGTDLAADGLDAVVRAVLERHDLVGPHADDPHLEVVDRVNDSGCYRFLLDHDRKSVEIQRLSTGSGTPTTLLRTSAGFRA
ncbi:beta-galactosidase [Pseudactinotalea terrae]|uniref:beta-galactosidase n=1 Tax=Pseudactinotalea terrae TaxID=1743262 RepID=UPI0012E25737|nr:beta-galactosidase [Pseudactinotalea terrae]